MIRERAGDNHRVRAETTNLYRTTNGVICLIDRAVGEGSETDLFDAAPQHRFARNQKADELYVVIDEDQTDNVLGALTRGPRPTSAKLPDYYPTKLPDYYPKHFAVAATRGTFWPCTGS